MNKDNFGDELRSIMEEEAKDIKISPELMDKILVERKKTWRDKINDFLNREIEIPFIPLVASLALVIMIISIPKDIFKRKDIRIINVGSAQIIVREYGRVSKDD